MENEKIYEMKIDLNVLNHLGINLYSNVPAVLSEVVANAWDADAEEVKIWIDDDQKEIIIEDTGSGMSYNDINNKYLTVGYSKREKGEKATPQYNRPVMGRKGIGKLSLFSLARTVEVYSKKGDEKNALKMNTEDIENQIKASDSKPYRPEPISTDSIDFEQGTRIILKDLNKKRLGNTATEAVKKRLARRFSILGEKHNFQVSVNDEPIKIEDRDYFHKIEYLWYYGEESKIYSELAKNKTKEEQRDNLLNGGHKISGWLGLVEKSTSLSDDNDNLNKIVLIVRGKMAKEDLLEEFREGGLYTKFLFGEIHADFLDDDRQPDIATSSRQDIFEGDDRYIALIKFIQSELKHIQKQRENFKTVDAEKNLSKHPVINDWYKTLGSDTKQKAKTLFGKIALIATDEKHQKELLAHGVLAFESLRYKDALNALENVSIDNFEEFIKIFKEFDEIESALYYKITKERLGIIDKLKVKVHDENALEKILQEYLFKYLWLLDPAWDRATETPYMEERVKTEFGDIDAKLTDDEKKGRIDIKYKKTSGKHIIVELKKASVKTSQSKLQGQVDKYIRALKKLLRETGDSNPQIEAVCVVGKELEGWEDPDNEKDDRNAMAAKNTSVVTYQQLIEDAYNSYKEYLEKMKEANTVQELIRKIEMEL
jgi:hypothetical protein